MYALTTLLAHGTILTDPGRLRAVNEDWCGSLNSDQDGEAVRQPSVWVVADGLSQHGTGREAARVAVETFLRAGWDTTRLDDGATLQATAAQANQRLWELGQQATPAGTRYATTIVAAVLRDGDASILSAGDCRAYLLRAGTIRQVTHDHTLAAEEVHLGRLRPEEAVHHPGRHTLTRCLGNRPTVQPDLFHERLLPGDRLLLCSDGLFRHVTDLELAQIGAVGQPAEAAHRLLDLANQRGGTDNITVGIVEVTDDAHTGEGAGRQETTIAPALRPTQPAPVLRSAGSERGGQTPLPGSIPGAQHERGQTAPATPASGASAERWRYAQTPPPPPAPGTPVPMPPATPWPVDASSGVDVGRVAATTRGPATVGPSRAGQTGQTLDGGHSEPPVSRLAILSTAARRLGAHPGLTETLDLILSGAVEVAEARRACILLRDEATGRPTFAAGRSLTAADLTPDRSDALRLVEGVMRSGQPTLAADMMLSDPGLGVRVSNNGHPRDRDQRSALCAPLSVGERGIGALYADLSADGAAFTLVDLDLLTTFASLSAAAIDTARLRARYEQQVHQIGALQTAQDRILRSVSSGIIAVDRAGIVTSCNRAAAEMLLVDSAAVVGTPLSAILPPRFMLALGAPFAGTGDDPGVTIQGFDMVGELRGRGYVHFEHRLSPLKDDAGATVGYVLALEDRTFLARLERERREAGAERERIMRIFGGMMSPDVLQEVLRIGGEASGFAGDRRTLTIMFADIRGFTGLSERLEPEDVVEILNGYLGAATDVILEHKGSIDKYIGDAVMALFGAPAPLENHALQAVKAALAMQKRFAQRPAPEGHRASFGIGINTGSGIVGMIGSPNVKSYTAIGDTVNVAARLEGEARAGEVLITDDTYQLVRDDVEVEGLGSIYVKGRITPVAVYKVLRLKNAKGGLFPSVERGAENGSRS